MAARALKLYVGATCPFCHRVEIAAHEKKVAYERVVVGLREDMPQWYKEINPRETVPTLEVGEAKRLVFESTLIAQYFDNIGTPAGSLMGSSPLQRHRIEFFLSQMGDFIGAAHQLLGDPLSAEKRKAVAENAAYVDGLLAANQTTGPFYFDEEFTMADVALVPFLVRLRPAMMYYSGYDVFNKAPRMKALWAAAAQRPSVRETTLPSDQCVENYRHLVPESAPMMGANGGYVLYGNKACPFVDRARLACALRRFKPYYVEIALHPQPEWYKFINPRETVPALFTPEGEAVHESQLIANYVDGIATEGAALLPRGDADKEYEVTFFIDNASNFVGAMYYFTSHPEDKDTKAELLWAAGELEKQLAKHPFGEGPFFGGTQMNLGDVSVLPFLVRLKAYTPALTAGYNLFSEFPLLSGLLEAGMASAEGKEVFLPLNEYLEGTLARRNRK
ncbi:Thiol-dependent reductase 1 [Leptomonas pyrrhocoris]|uniref:Thiol-dependent reductase 1 n=1 Tax=Leptomonas pyrrhocoris TaxID=157538 RepID=A0A0N0DT12_LEPPY|nr:Thiol-dependent reductase 1 [Leptomonas pyrrhocoris]KPA76838.1 Thiol-dependent reductase 1 [Leptomonas pyrrhocoris]|eukprot:XP_015655277.1 Thiol-dependent reductase 1 [Leptomonas pyrrhocoris]